MPRKKTYKLNYQTCPICHRKYLPPDDRTSPTCGDPNCIREARAKGLPFISQPLQPSPVQPGAKQRTRGKATFTK